MRLDRDFLKSVRLAAASNLLIQGVGSATGLALAYVLEPIGRGQYAAVMAWTGAFALIGALGLTSSITYFVATEPCKAAHYFETAKRLLLALGVLCGFLGLALTPLLAVSDSDLQRAYVVGFAALPLVFLNGSWVFGLQARDLRSWATVRTAYPLAYAAALVTLQLLGRLTVVTALVSIVAAGVFQGIFARRAWARACHDTGTYVACLVSPLLRYGRHSLAATLPHLINTRLDQVALSLMVPLSDLGSYAVAVSLSLLAFPVTSAFGNVALPTIASQRGQDPSDARATMRLALFGTAVAGIVVAIATAVAVGPIVKLAPAYGDVPKLTYILAPGAVFLGLNQVLSDVLRAHDKALQVAKAEALAAVVTVLLFAVLVPQLGVLGAAISSTASYGTACCFLLAAAARSKRIDR